MKRARALAASSAIVLALAACRAVIGIESLSVEDADAGHGVDSGGPPDALSTADAADTSPPPFNGQPLPPGDAGACVGSDAAGGCKGCCRQRFASLYSNLEAHMRDSGCICGSGACSGTNQCGPYSCATPPAGPAMPQCGSCEDPAFLGVNAACVKGGTDCYGDPACGPAIGCLTGCPPDGP